MILSGGIISGARGRRFEEVDTRVLQIAGGLQKLGVREGDCVCILMRNDIAFLEASYAVMTLGGYAVPINWHFKPEEISYIIKDTATRVLIGHTDLLNLVRDVIPDDVTVLSVPTPPEILASYKIDAAHLDTPRRANDLETWLADQKPYSGPKLPPPQSMIYTSGTTGNPKGVRRNAPTPAQIASAEAMRALIYGLKPGVRTLLPGPLYHSAPNA
jgi:long-chain acyl-CoA synthetase